MQATHFSHMTNEELITEAENSSDLLAFELGRRLAGSRNYSKISPIPVAPHADTSTGELLLSVVAK